MRLKPPLSVEVITKSISKNSLVNKMKEKIKKNLSGLQKCLSDASRAHCSRGWRC